MTAIARLRLVVASAVLLFAELAIVRWTGSELSRLAFFKNLVLIAAFLGAGLGMTLWDRRPKLGWLAPPLFVLLAPAVPLIGGSRWIRSLRFGSKSDFHWQLSETPDVHGTIAFILFFVIVFAVAVLFFAALGVPVGRALSGQPPLEAYAWNLFGSLMGVLVFAVASYLELGPVAWFLILALPLGWTLASGWRRWAPASLVVALAALLIPALSGPLVWSMYSRVAVREWRLATTPPTIGWQIDVDRDYFMKVLDLRSAAASLPWIDTARLHYDFPYQFGKPGHVLVLGAGGGNDVAAALRAGVAAIDAVEIDPAIVRLGQSLHPERPYGSAGVNVVVDDARSFLGKTDGHYDLVVLGLLDSHTLLAGLPGVRLDNFVYTLESLREMRRHLSPGGLLALSFAVPVEGRWISLKLYRLVAEAFGEAPLVFSIGYDSSVMFLAGPGIHSVQAADAARRHENIRLSQARLEEPLADGPIALPTDDWPHLYLRDRLLPPAQLFLLLLLLSLAAFLLRITASLSGRPDLHFALLGAGFLLVETRGISDLGLLFGGTWWTVTATISSLLLMALLSTLFVWKRRPVSRRPYYLGLGTALVVGWLIRPSSLLGLPLPAAQVLGSALVATPVFFSGIVFALSLLRSEDTARALGWNLLGAVIGGFLEYASLVWGVRALTLVALIVYALSAVALLKQPPPALDSPV